MLAAFAKQACYVASAIAFLFGSTVEVASGLSSKTEENLPRIGIIIDDLGVRLDEGQRAVNLPGPVACAFLPHGRHTRSLAKLAHAEAKEVLLHLPMQAIDPPSVDVGGLTLDMTHRQVVNTVLRNLDRVPHVAGINNHMGSLLTRHPGHMRWVMEALQQHLDLFFVDSRTTKHTVAQQLAKERGVPSVSRDVFLDGKLADIEVNKQFRRLIRLAQKNGSALAIGHPHPTTLSLLARELKSLERYGVQLVPISRLAH